MPYDILAEKHKTQRENNHVLVIQPRISGDTKAERHKRSLETSESTWP